MRESKVEKASQPISKPDPATPKTSKVPTAAATSASAAATPAAKFGVEKTDSSTTAPAASPSTNSDAGELRERDSLLHQKCSSFQCLHQPSTNQATVENRATSIMQTAHNDFLFLCADDPHGLRRRKTSSTAASASSNATTSTTSPTPTPAAAPAEAAAGTNSQAGGSNGVGGASRPTYAPASYAPHAARAAGGADANGAAIARAASRRTQVCAFDLLTLKSHQILLEYL